MSEKIILIDPFIHKKANISRDEFLKRLEFVKAIRTRKYQLSFYFDSPNKWEDIEHFHYLINSSDFSKQKLPLLIPFAYAIPVSLFNWMKETPLNIIQKQILFFLSGYYVFNPFKEFVPKELLKPIWDEVLKIVNEYYPKDYESSFISDDEEDYYTYEKMQKENIEYYLKAAKSFIGKELPEIFNDPTLGPNGFHEDCNWGSTRHLQFEYSISYFTEMDWITIVTRNPKELKIYGIDDPVKAKKRIEAGAEDDLLRDESDREMFEKWKYIYKMYELRGSTIYSLFSNVEEKKDSREKIPQHIIDKVWRRDLGKCATCGSKEKLEIDHIIPFSKGGSNTYRNLQLLCEKCNRTKHNKIG